MLSILKKEGVKIAAAKSAICLAIIIAALIFINFRVFERIRGFMALESINNSAELYEREPNYLKMTEEEFTITIALTGISVIAGLYAFGMLSRAFTGAYQREITKYLKKNENVSMEQIEMDFFRAELIDKRIWVGRRWIIYLEGATAKIVDNKNTIWAYYKERTEVRKYISTIYRTIILNGRDKKTTMIDLSSQQAGIRILENYRKNQQHIVLGYSDEILEFYINHFDEFLKRRDIESNKDINSNRDAKGVIEYKMHKVYNA